MEAHWLNFEGCWKFLCENFMFWRARLPQAVNLSVRSRLTNCVNFAKGSIKFQSFNDYMRLILIVVTSEDCSFQAVNFNPLICIQSLRRPLLMCFDISQFECHERLWFDWRVDSSCDWPTGWTDSMNVFICFTPIKNASLVFEPITVFCAVHFWWTIIK